MPTHYDVLGVRPTASADEIRAAYRQRAREAHPDALAGSSAVPSNQADMAAINAAWHALSDPGRRAVYDASLRNPQPTPASGSTATRSRVPDVPIPVQRGSGRFPIWPFVLVGVLAVIFIFSAGALTKPSTPPAPDNLLFTGSCVRLEANRDAVEVGCEGPHDATVVTVVNFDAVCPTESETFRDKQGRGYACVKRVP
ncbi:MAG: J domain-containing protein [Ilumatobacteraceae bacterium]